MKALSNAAALVMMAGFTALALSSFQAQAEPNPISGFISGNKLLELCDAPFGTNNQAWCDGYIIGVDDTLTITEAVSGTAGASHRYYCLRQDVTLGQTSLVVLNYLKAHPDKLDLIASELVIAALAEAFPCPSP